MSNETQQPFEKPTQRNSQDIELVEQVLGSQEAEDMRALTGEQVVEEKPDTDDLGDADLSVTAAEQAVVNKAEFGVNAEERRQQFIAWAEEFDETESYVNRYFRFEDDGTVVMIDGHLMDNKNISWLPPGVKKVEKNLFLSQNKLTNCDNIPNVIEGQLDLTGNPITDLSGLSGVTIKGDLVLHNILATEIPADIKVKVICIKKGQQDELARDAEEKGYNVFRPDPDNDDIREFTVLDSKGNPVIVKSFHKK